MYRKAGHHPLLTTLLRIPLFLYFFLLYLFFVQVRAGRQDGKSGRGGSAEKGGGGDEASYGGKKGSGGGESTVR